MISRKELNNFKEAYRILVQEDNSIYIQPHVQLARYISHYNINFPMESLWDGTFTIIPHGRVTLAVEFDGSNFQFLLFGPTTKPQTIQSDPSIFHMIIEFQVGGFYAFGGIDQHDLTDRVIPLELLDYSLCTNLQSLLEEELEINRLIQKLDHLLLSIHHPVGNPLLTEAIGCILSSREFITTKRLSHELHYSERHMNRIFNQNLGMSTKTFVKLLRMNRVIYRMNQSNISSSMIAESLGYYDMSHFIRDFKTICGVTPTEYRKNMSDFYSAIAKD